MAALSTKSLKLASDVEAGGLSAPVPCSWLQALLAAMGLEVKGWEAGLVLEEGCWAWRAAEAGGVGVVEVAVAVMVEGWLVGAGGVVVD